MQFTCIPRELLNVPHQLEEKNRGVFFFQPIFYPPDRKTEILEKALITREKKNQGHQKKKNITFFVAIKESLISPFFFFSSVLR